MKLPWNILRTNPYWRFAGKNRNVGQKCNFPTKFSGKIFLKRYISPQGYASASQPMIRFCRALSVEHVCQIWWRSDLNSGRYNDFLGAFFDIFCVCRFISAVFCPDFFWDPLLKTSPGRFTSQQNHLALNTKFQRSSNPGRKVVGLRKFFWKRKMCKINFRPPKVKELPHN